MSVREEEVNSSSSPAGDNFASVAIQWHIWLHSGSWALGASGSVRAIVSWILSLLTLRVPEGTTSNKSIEGCFFAFFGLTLLPSSAVAFFQVTFRVSRGVKGSRIVGIMFAFSSLMGRVEEGGLSDWVIFNFFDSCRDWLTL